jgi:hypothetical protein
MIGVLKSSINGDDYATKRLHDFGLRWFRYIESAKDDLSEFHLLLVPKCELSKEETENILDFLENKGSVISLYPNEELVQNVGSLKEVLEVPPDQLSGHVVLDSIDVPVFGRICNIGDTESLLEMAGSEFPALARRRFDKGSLFVFSYSLSDSVMEITQRLLTVNLKLGDGVKWGDYPGNLLDGTEEPLDVPYSDVQMMYLRSLILTELHRQGIALPIVWHVPYAKKTCVMITMDEDWANPCCLDHSLNLLAERNLPSTLFVTEKVEGSKAFLFQDECDLAVHPFHKDATFSKDTLRRSTGFLSESPKGVRNHWRLVARPEMFSAEIDLGFQWESNFGVSKTSGFANGTAHPFFLWDNDDEYDLLEFPIHFEDDLYLFEEASFDFRESIIRKMLDESRERFFSCLNLAFHPIHLFLNSTSIADYEDYKQHGASKNDQRLQEYRASLPTRKGIESLFTALLDHLVAESHDILVTTCQKINDYVRDCQAVEIGFDNRRTTVSGCFEGLTILIPFADESRSYESEDLFAKTQSLDVGGIRCVLGQVSSEGARKGRIEIEGGSFSSNAPGTEGGGC